MNWQFSFTTCEFTWWEHLIWTLIPFLLGLLLGYVLWNRFRRQKAGQEQEVDKLRAENKALQADLEAKDARISVMEERLTRIESDLSSSRLAYRSLQTQHDSLKATAAKPVTASAPVPAVRKRKDPLTRIEGIGPKTQEYLYANEIQSFDTLGQTRVTTLRKLLKEGGANFRLLDPGTWPKQARLAAKGDWDKLQKLQDRLIGGREPEKARPDPDVSGTAEIFGKKIKLNDLKIVEGIGPKIEGLLKKAGIDTWWALADSPVKAVQAVLNEAGPRYRLADPGTWPKQARMAARGQWKKLKKYQDELSGGKE